MLNINNLHVSLDDKPILNGLTLDVPAGEVHAVMGPNGARKSTLGYALAGPCSLPHDEVTPACGELKRIYFRKARQGGGLGGALFAQVTAWLLQDGPRDIWIGVWSENFGAQRFYERQGFAKVGEYGFHVGRTVDREFILRRSAGSFSN